MYYNSQENKRIDIKETEYDIYKSLKIEVDWKRTNRKRAPQGRITREETFSIELKRK